MKLQVILKSSNEGGYTIYVPTIPGCISEGETKQEATRLYLEPIDDSLILPLH